MNTCSGRSRLESCSDIAVRDPLEWVSATFRSLQFDAFGLGDAVSEIPRMSDIEDVIDQAREAVSGGRRSQHIRVAHIE